MKTIVKLTLLLLTILIVLIIRTLWYAGTFSTISPSSNQETTLIRGIVGSEDITIDKTTGLALVSSCNRRKVILGEPVKGAIYLLDFTSSPESYRNLTATFEQVDFRPHGISLFIDPIDSTKWLYVVNHRISGHSIEIFQFKDTSLLHVETIRSSLIIKPNDVVGVGKRSFYFTNDHNSDDRGFSALKDYFLIGTGSVGYYDGQKIKLLDEGIRYANGIAASSDSKKLYVAACTDRSINIYEREPFKKIGNIQCKTGVDNLEWDIEGNLWVGAHPKLLKFLGHAKDSSNLSPSQVLKINLQKPESPIVSEIYVNEGTPLSGSSVAAMHNGTLLVGGVFDDGILKINLKK